MKRLTFLWVVLAVLAQTGIAQEVGNTYEKLYARFLEATQFSHRYPREQVYLHLDNNAYFEDDTIWVKAYVYRPAGLIAQRDADRDESKLLPLSRVLYVDLLNVSGQLVTQRLLRIDSIGQANGEIELSLPVKCGYYEIRAYTREMVNWGADAYFSRVIPVFRRPKSFESIDVLEIDRPESKRDLMPSAPRPMNFDKTSEIRLSMFPEGGNRINNVPARIAYKLTDGRGTPVDAMVRLWCGDSVVTQSVPLHLGMGSFVVPPYCNDAYVTVGNKRFDLPAATGDYALGMLENDIETSFLLNISRRPDIAPQLLGLVVTCRDEVCYFDTLRLIENTQVLEVPMEALRGGVNRIELFDAEGRSLCRRLVWKTPETPDLNVCIRQNAVSYEPFSPIALEFDVQDHKGNPVQTTFSLSVRDGHAELVCPERANIAADLLLASELRGYVHRPEDYFVHNDEAHRRALDLLLLVQGWTPTSFEEMSGAIPFVITEPIEERLLVKGRVYKENDKKVPLPNQKLHIGMISRAGAALSGDTRTDSLGRFVFESSEDYCGEWLAQFTTTTEKGRRRWSRIALDRFYDLPPRLIDWDEMELTPPLQRSEEEEAAQVTTFEWTDTIMRVVPIDFGEATVVSRSKYVGFHGNRYTYNGGEEAGMNAADVFYNIEQEVERLKDRGEGVGSVWELLASLNHDFICRSKPDGGFELLYNGKSPAAVFINNYGDMRLSEGMLWADEIKSVAFVFDRSRWERFLPEAPSSASSLIDADGNQIGDYAIFLYDRPNYSLYRMKRGVDKRLLEGFTQPLPFLAPTYNGADLPSSSDLRRTLYWNPSVTTDAQGHASVVFYSNAREGLHLRLSVRGITPQGLLGVERFR